MFHFWVDIIRLLTISGLSVPDISLCGEKMVLVTHTSIITSILK